MNKNYLVIKEHLYNELKKEIKSKASSILNDKFEFIREYETPFFTHIEFKNKKGDINITLTFPTRYTKSIKAKIELNKHNIKDGKLVNKKKVTYYIIDDNADSLLQELRKIKTELILKGIFKNR